MSAGDLLWSPVLRKFPELVVALSEGGIGWIPYFLERVDRVYDNHHAWTHQDFGDQLPSEVFRERIVTCFIHDTFGVESRKHLNLDLLTWECDYPHSDSSWPTAPESIAEYGDALSERELAKITHENAIRIFSFDPFTHVPASRPRSGRCARRRPMSTWRSGRRRGSRRPATRSSPSRPADASDPWPRSSSPITTTTGGPDSRCSSAGCATRPTRRGTSPSWSSRWSSSTSCTDWTGRSSS